MKYKTKTEVQNMSCNNKTHNPKRKTNSWMNSFWFVWKDRWSGLSTACLHNRAVV